jgi:protein SCO1/2
VATSSSPERAAAGAASALHRKVALLVLGLAAALAGAWLARESAAPAKLETAVLYPMPRRLPDFALVREDGSPFGAAQLAGRWSLLYFGYTSCPDVCPATLALLKALPARLADLPAAQRPLVYFVSVDPEQDSAARLKEYVHFFDPEFRALTGTPGAIGDFAGALGAAVLSDRAGGTRRIDHSAALYLTDPTGRLVAVFPAPQRLPALEADYRKISRRGAGRS